MKINSDPAHQSGGDPQSQILLRCKAIVGSLPIPRPFDVDVFRAALEARRNRMLVLTAATLPPGCTGLWVASRRADYIFYDRDVAPAEQLRAIGHELGHMILGHRGTQISASEFARLLFPHLDPNKVATALGLVPVIARYSEAEDADADVFASLLLDRIGGTA